MMSKCPLFAAVLAGVAALASPTTAQDNVSFDSAGALTEFRSLSAASADRLPTLDRALEDADFDAETLIEFVSSDILYHPYNGVQRGVEGTLLAGAGNSWDQAITLAGLLTEAGYDSVVAFGSVSGVDFPPAQAARPDGDVLPEPGFEVLAETRADQVLAAIEAADLALGSAGAATEASYAWVRWRDSPGDPFTDVHPIFASAPDTTSFEQEGSVSGLVPQDQVAMMSVRAFIEVESEGRVRRQWVSDAVSGAIANMWGVRQVYAFAPATSAVVAVNPPDEADGAVVAYQRLLGSPSFIATRNDAPMDGAENFNRRGDVLSPELAASAMAGVFETIATDTGEAADALSALGGAEGETESVVAKVVGAGFEITVTIPGSKPQVFVRRMLPPGSDPAENAVWFADLTQTFDLVVQPGPVPDALVQGLVADDYVAMLTAFEEQNTDPNSNPITRFTALEFQSSPAMTSSMPVASAGRVLAPDTAQSGPMIAALITRLSATEDLSSLQERRIYDILQRPVSGAAEPALRRGVAETLAERFALSPDAGGGAATILGAAESLVVVESLEALDTVSIADIARDAIAADIEAGEIVLIPDVDAPAIAWWRVDPETGQTLGRSHVGWGSEVGEYLSAMQIGFHTMQMMIEMTQCIPKSPAASGARVACVLCAAANHIGDILTFDENIGKAGGFAQKACKL